MVCGVSVVVRCCFSYVGVCVSLFAIWRLLFVLFGVCRVFLLVVVGCGLFIVGCLLSVLCVCCLLQC